MTIVGWIIFGFAAIMAILICIALGAGQDTGKKVLLSVVCALIVGGILVGLLLYFNNTASGKRALLDQKSNFNNGIERVINVYTANGDLLATYKGKIDIADADGGYIKFDFNNKRYIYYNCFVETIADLE